jgi:hypothetical protein
MPKTPKKPLREGCCPVCNSIQPLTKEGRIRAHKGLVIPLSGPEAWLTMKSAPCKGGGRKPKE